MLNSCGPFERFFHDRRKLQQGTKSSSLIITPSSHIYLLSVNLISSKPLPSLYGKFGIHATSKLTWARMSYCRPSLWPVKGSSWSVCKLIRWTSFCGSWIPFTRTSEGLTGQEAASSIRPSRDSLRSPPTLRTYLWTHTTSSPLTLTTSKIVHSRRKDKKWRLKEKNALLLKNHLSCMSFSCCISIYTNVLPFAGSYRWTFRLLRCTRKMSTKTSSRKSLSSPASPNTMA